MNVYRGSVRAQERGVRRAAKHVDIIDVDLEMDGADGYARCKLCDVGVLFAERLYIYRCGFGFVVCALGFVEDTIAWRSTALGARDFLFLFNH